MVGRSAAEESVKEAEQPRIRPGVWALCKSTDPARHKHEERAALSRGSGVHSKLMSRKPRTTDSEKIRQRVRWNEM